MLPYRPHPLLKSGHLQTLMVGFMCGQRPAHNAVPIEIPLADGEKLIVHEEMGSPIQNASDLVILIHGLGGDHRSPYLQRIALRLRQAGVRVWRVDLRGCGDGLRLAWRPAHAGSSEDLAAVVHAATSRYPGSPIHVVGFSLSGNILLKMLGEAATGALHSPLNLSAIASTIAIAPPINLSDCADNMDRFTRSLYTRYYLRVLAEQVQLRSAQWPQWRQVPSGPPIKTIRQFDARYTAPLAGFESTDHYYSQASSARWLQHVTTPTTLMVDRHDPIVTVKSLDAAHLNPNSTELIVTSHGGHMGYFGLDESGRLIRWMEHFVVQQLKSKIGQADARTR